MNRLSLILLLSCLATYSFAQPDADYGIYSGVSTYMGDINTERLLYAPSPSAGIFYRYNFHPRQSLRISINHGLFKADDTDFDNDFQQNRGHSFRGSITEISTQFEFNFFPYSTMGRKWDFTPYFSAGIGASFFNSQTTTIQPVIPFTIGMKVNIHKNMGLEAEYGFRKTFYDNFDGLLDNISPDDHSILHNNDWYCFTGISITWKIFDRYADCPTYNDVYGKRR